MAFRIVAAEPPDRGSMGVPPNEHEPPPGRAENGSGRHAATRTLPGLAYRVVFLTYLAAVSGFGNAFAHLHVTVAGLPLFSGEITIALLVTLGAAHLWKARADGPKIDGIVVALAAFLLLGCVYAAVGLARGFGVAALRDFAIVYYATFFLLTLAFRLSGGSPSEILLALIAGSTVGAGWTLGRFLLAPRLSWGHGAGGQQAIVAWLAVLAVALIGFRPGPRWARVSSAFALACCCAAIFLSAARTMLIVIAGVAVAGAAMLRWRDRSSVRRVIVTALTGVALWGAIVVGIATLVRPVGGSVQNNGPMPLIQALRIISVRWADLGFVAQRLARRWDADPHVASPSPTHPHVTSPAPAEPRVVSPSPTHPHVASPSPATPLRVTSPLAVPNLATEKSFDFRVSAWRNAARRIAASPLVGIGFGPAPRLFPDKNCELITSPTSNCGNAHNTYLTLAMRMGIPVLVAFLILNLLEVIRSLRALVRSQDSEVQVLLLFSLMALLSLGIYASLSLFLESPYLASLYWIILALMHESGEHLDRLALSGPGPSSPA